MATNRLLTCFVVVVIVCNGAGAQNVYLASVSSTGEQANDQCFGWISPNGSAVLLISQATNLIEQDTNGSIWDVFVQNLGEGVTSVETVNSKGEQQNNQTQVAGISATGRFIVFDSSATNLVPGSNGAHHVYLRDRFLNITELISVSSTGEWANSFCGAGSVSADGRFVTFASNATNLAPFPYTPQQCFVRDRLTGETSIAGLRSDGTPPQQLLFVSAGAISDDGRFVAFLSDAIDLVPGFTTALERIYHRDRDLSQTIHISVPYNGSNPNGKSYFPSMTSDGRYVAFASNASNLVPNDTNNATDVFVRDMLLGQTTRVSVSSKCEQGNGPTGTGVNITADGRYVIFGSFATNLVEDDVNGWPDGFVHDRWTGTTELVSLNWMGEQLYGWGGVSGISNDGRLVSLVTQANNVIPEPVNGMFAVYVRERWKLGDVNRDGIVNVIDLLAIINAWGPCPLPPEPPALPIPCDADVTNDNSVNVADLLLIINNWG